MQYSSVVQLLLSKLVHKQILHIPMHSSIHLEHSSISNNSLAKSQTFKYACSHSLILFFFVKLHGIFLILKLAIKMHHTSLVHITHEFLNSLWINTFLVLDFYGYKKWFIEKSFFHFRKILFALNKNKIFLLSRWNLY